MHLNLNNNALQRLQKIFPLVESLKDYSFSFFKADLIAGLTVGILLVPQGMAYAFLAGLPPIYGLYGGLVPLLLYALLGTSRQMSIGPVAISALLILAGVSQLAEPGTASFISLVLTTGLLVGLVQVIFSFLRMGFLINFLSHPVVAGFTSAAAIIIAISQLKDLLGFPIPRFAHPHETLLYAVEHIAQTNWIAVLLCLSAIVLILGFRAINKNIPGALVIVIIGALLSWGIDLQQYGLDIIREVPKGLPDFQLPDFQLTTIQKLIPTVLTVTIIGIVESLGIAKVLEAKHQDYVVRPNQELLALGMAKIGGTFFQALPTSGSFTRSAVNNDAGAKTGISSLVTVFLIALTLLFLTPLFYYLPKAILAAIILLAVKGLFDIKEAIHLWRSHKRDFIMMIVTFVATLVLGIEYGVLMGVILSIMTVLYRSSRPHVVVLGKIPGTTHFRNIERFEDAQQPENVLIMRFDDQLYFANATFFKDTVKQLVLETNRNLKYFYLDARSIHDIDSSGLQALKESYRLLQREGIQLCICGAIGPVRDILFKSGFTEEIGKENHFMYIHNALRFHQKIMEKTTDNIEWSPDALQTNMRKKPIN